MLGFRPCLTRSDIAFMGMAKGNKSKSKTTLDSGGTCVRCTALMRAGMQRCSMCSWPVDVAFPVPSGEIETVDAPMTEPELAEVVGAQVEALDEMPESVASADSVQDVTVTEVVLDPLTAPIDQL